MSDSGKKPRIIFLNQMAGPLFRELAEDISKEWSPSIMLTGHPDTLSHSSTDSLRIVATPTYKRSSYLSRIFSWVQYLAYVSCWCLRLPKSALLFVVFPPFLEVMAYVFRLVRGQRYVVLIYDIYPDTLISFGPLSKSGLIARLWRRVNRLAWEKAEIVFTIGDRMAENLARQFDARKTKAGKVIVIPNWADTDWIRPIAKDENDFAKKYDQVEKLTVMYSGNLGQTHDIETIVAAAKELKKHDSIHFMIIGEGAKRTLVEETKLRYDLDNLTVLPFQPENTLRVSLPTADIAIVTLDKGSEGLSVPSKTFYYMSAGSALIGLCDDKSEVAHVIGRHNCGFVVSPGDTNALVSGISDLLYDREKLDRYRTNSRTAAEQFYSRNNTRQYLDMLSSINAAAGR